MVLALFAQIAIMLIDRYIYLTVTSESLVRDWQGQPALLKKTSVTFATGCKVVLHIVLTVAIHALLFWVLPILGNVRISGEVGCKEGKECNDFQRNWALRVFYCLWLAYLLLSAVQLRLGMPTIRDGSFPLTQYRSLCSKWLFQVYLQVPFLFELRTLTDWAFTSTALDFWQWLKFEDVYGRLYIAKINQSYYLQREPGQPIDCCYKFWVGIVGTIGLIVMLLAPLVLFSDLNLFVYENPIKTIAVEFGFLIENRNYYKIFSASRVTDIHYMSEAEWEKMGLDQVRDVSRRDREDMQVLTIPLSGDSIWDITPEGRFSLQQSLYDPRSSIHMLMTTSYIRDYPPHQHLSVHSFQAPLSNAHIQQQLATSEGTRLRFPKLFSSLWRLPSVGDQLTPTMIERDIEQFLPDIEFHLEVYKDQFEYWRMGRQGAEGKLAELKVYVISEKHSPATLNFGVVTFYLTVVFFAGKMLRMVTGGSAENFIMSEVRRPDMLLDLGNAIYLARMVGNLKEEEELFYELIDIMRSPATMLIVTGRSAIREVSKSKTD